MDTWPDLKADEATIVNHLDSLRNGLTKETAEKLSTYGSCQFWVFSKYNAEEYDDAFESYLKLLLDIARLVPRSTFLNNFPKSCAGCAIEQFFSIVAMHPTLHSEVAVLLQELLYDKNKRILQMLPDIEELARMVQDAYDTNDYPFPYIALCLRLERKSEIYKIVRALGSMIASHKFLQQMEKNTEEAILIAQKMINDLEDPFFSDWALTDLMKDM